jgi:putative tryptophan/tyrosine transport system substrate-binding protein
MRGDSFRRHLIKEQPEMPMSCAVRWLRIVPIAIALVASVGAAHAQKRIAITSISEVPQVLDLKRGLLEELAKLGYVDGKNLTVEYVNALGDFKVQQQIAKQFADESFDVVVPITTPTTIAVVKAEQESQRPVVFSMVTDPVGAKVVPSLKHPGGMVTGVSDIPPIELQVELIRRLVPLKRLGFIYNPSLASSQTFLADIKQLAAQDGFSVVEAASPNTSDVLNAARSLVGNVDAIYVPNDTTVTAALESVIKVGLDEKLPIFTGESRGVERGGIASLSFDYYDVGTATAPMVKAVLEGEKPGDIDVLVMKDVYKKFQLVINLKSAAAMGVNIPDSLKASATKLIQ